MKEALTSIERRGFLAVAGSAVAMALCAPALAHSVSPVETLTGNAFGTSWRIVLGGTGVDTLFAPVSALLEEIDRQMSPWRADSELSRFNRSAAGYYPVSAATSHVAAAALELASLSGGAFDPLVGPLVARWGFGPISEGIHTRCNGVFSEPGAIRKLSAAQTLDLCGIAKGYALDRLSELLRQAGHEDFLIDLGGEVVALGQHPSGRAWQAGVEDPRPDESGIAEILRLDGMAVATSGDRENAYMLGNRRYSHIIDPLTKAPVAGSLASVSVLATSAMLADGWATALMAAGTENGPQLARQNEIPALFLFRDPAGLRRVSIGGFERQRA